jgi:hypothetical protein
MSSMNMFSEVNFRQMPLKFADSFMPCIHLSGNLLPTSCHSVGSKIANVCHGVDVLATEFRISFDASF